jgi:hypothetical protein
VALEYCHESLRPGEARGTPTPHSVPGSPDCGAKEKARRSGRDDRKEKVAPSEAGGKRMTRDKAKIYEKPAKERVNRRTCLCQQVGVQQWCTPTMNSWIGGCGWYFVRRVGK